jgi:hypothetical protein
MALFRNVAEIYQVTRRHVTQDATLNNDMFGGGSRNSVVGRIIEAGNFRMHVKSLERLTKATS